MNLRQKPANRPPRHQRRGTALYIAVLSTTLIVSLLGLAGMAIVRIERRQATSVNDRLIARTNARSAVEVALQIISQDADWRTTYTNGVETAQRALGPDSAGTVSYILADSDGSLSDADTELTLKGVGRAGDAVQVSSVRVTPSVGPILFKESATMSNFEYVDAANWWAQYIKPDLPADATEWTVTRVEFTCGKSGGAKQVLVVKLYHADASNMPGTEVDAVSVDESTLPAGAVWISFDFASQVALDPNQGVCVSMECQESSAAAFFHYLTSGNTDPNTGLIRGSQSGGWTTYEPGGALKFRLHGTYKTDAGLQAISGTWTHDGYP